MNVILRSQDEELHNLCRDILNQFHGVAWNLTRVTQQTPPADADLYVWDGQVDAGLPRTSEEGVLRHLFLLSRDELPKVHQKAASAPGAILLKPVTRAGLAAFLGMAVSAYRDQLFTAHTSRLDRDELLQWLVQSNLKLRECGQQRTNFLARAVRDLSAPLSAASGYCSLILSDGLGCVNQDQKEVLERMQHSIKRVSRMVSAMFEVSTGEHSKKLPDLHPGKICECVEQALQEITPFAEDKRISVSVDVEPETGTLYLERGQMEQALLNLLDNSCKFTPKGGAIEIHGYPFFWERRSTHRDTPPAAERRSLQSPAPNSYRVDIRDSGQRIPREHLEKIFDEYTPYAGGQDRSGGGLGLAICRMIIRTHEGRVWAENTEYGPRFSLVLPVRSTEQSGTRQENNPDPAGVEAR